MTFDIGTFVVGLFLVLAFLEGYSLCRPASTAEDVLLFRRRVAAAAVVAVPILVLFFLRGWREAAAGAVFLAVLIAGYFYLYRRILPYVRYTGPRRAGGRPNGDKIANFFQTPVTLAGLLELHNLNDLAPFLLDAFVVSGSSNQDGTYQRDGMCESLPYYKCVGSDTYIWYYRTDQRWHIGSGGPGSASAEIRVMDLDENLEAVPTGSWEAWDGSNFISSSVSVTKTTSNRSLESIASITGGELRDLGRPGAPRDSTARATQLRRAYQERPRGPNHFRDLLNDFHETGALPDELGTCERILVRWSNPDSVMGYVERRTFEEVTGIIARSYTRPRWYHRPWRHRLHYTLKQRVERYDTEFAAERDAWEELNLRVKEREAAGRPPSRELKKLRQEALEKDLALRGMVLRVLTCVEINQ